MHDCSSLVAHCAAQHVLNELLSMEWVSRVLMINRRVLSPNVVTHPLAASKLVEVVVDLTRLLDDEKAHVRISVCNRMTSGGRAIAIALARCVSHERACVCVGVCVCLRMYAHAVKHGMALAGWLSV